MNGFGNGAPAVAVSAWNALSADAQEIMIDLDNANAGYAKAMDEALVANKELNAAQQAYDDALAEFKAEVMFSPDFQDNKAAQKNAETRSAWMDAALVKARAEGGALAVEWRELLTAKERNEQAKVDVEAAKRVLTAVQFKAQLVASLVHGVQA